MRSLLLSSVAALALAASAQAYTNPIEVKGYKMFDAKTGDYFTVKGVDYYPRPNAGELDENNVDFFTDAFADVWGPDIPFLAAVGANAVRLYAVDPSQSHDQFMCALRSHGMYALVDLGAACENCSITVDEYPACYPTALKTRGEQIISEFAQYDNVLAFSAGNEVNNIVDDAFTNAPCQKKFLRDMRAFMGGCSSLRTVPVGVVVADPDTTNNNREVNAKYYNCRTDAKDKYENADWYGINTYQQCDGKVTELADAGGFRQLLTDFSSFDMTIPVLLTEFGCINPSFPTEGDYEAQRTWLQAGWLHESDFRKVFSGGFVFEFSTENSNSKSSSAYPFTTYGEQNYGLGYYSPEDCDHDSVPCVYNPMPNYDDLAAQYNATDVSDEASSQDFTPDRTTLPACPSNFPALADVEWEADSVDSLECPSTAQQYECPGQKTSGVWATSSSGSTADEEDSDGEGTVHAGSGSSEASPSTDESSGSSAAGKGSNSAATLGTKAAAAVVVATLALAL